jgi:hypothetical protein
MQALEGLHRSIESGLYVSEDSYRPIEEELVRAIPKNVKSDHRDSLKSRIKYGNEISLSKRLDALTDRLSVPIRKLILGGNGVIPRSWVDTRNYYTHWDEALRPRTLDGIAMHRASTRMRTLLRVLYLQLVGVPDSAIIQALRNGCDESQYLTQLNAAEHRSQHPYSEAGALMRIDVGDAQSPSASSA